MKKGTIKVITLAVMMAALLTGCGAKSASSTESAVMDNSGVYDRAATEEAADAGGASEGSTVPEESGRKLIEEVSLDVETDQYDVLWNNISAQVKAMGGYIESSYTGEYKEAKRNGNMTIRIPAKELDAFVGAVSENANVKSKSNSIEDVTLQYVDLEARIESMKTERDTLLSMLEKTENLEDIILVQDRLTQVLYEIESAESQRRVLQGRVDYSTVYLQISEVVSVKANSWERMGEGFAQSAHNVSEGIAAFFIGIIISLPYIFTVVVILGIIGLIVWFIVWLAQRKNKKAAMKKPEENRNDAKEL